jgi:hypothetical protein
MNCSHEKMVKEALQKLVGAPRPVHRRSDAEMIADGVAHYWRRYAAEAERAAKAFALKLKARDEAERERQAIKDADYWERRALAAEDAVQDMALDLYNRDKAALAAAPKQPHPHAALYRAIGVSYNGGHDPQTHNQVFWERLP